MKNKKGKHRTSEATEISEYDAEVQEEQSVETKQEPARKKVKKENDLYRPPTSEELNNLREAETLFHSSLFRLQTDEFCKEIFLKDKWKRSYEKWFQSFKNELLNFEVGNSYELSDFSWLNKMGVKYPIPECESTGPQKGVFQFHPPTDVKIVGSYSAQLSSKLNLTVDAAILVPKEFWQGSDYLNNRYCTKRALYLCHLSWALQKCSLVDEIHFTCLQGDHTRPALVITPKGQWKVAFKLCLLPHPPDGLFKRSRFRPSTNNIRPSWYYGGQSEVPDDVPTPVYNNSILLDVLLVEHSQYVQDSLKDAQGVKEALNLLRAWLRNRGLSQGLSGFTPFMMMMFVIHLLSTRRISWMMSSYQIVRNVFLELGQSNWSSSGLSMCKGMEENQPLLEDFHKHFSVVFVDPSGFLNICANMDTATYKRVKHEAELGLDLLNSFWSDSFEFLFIDPLPFNQTFDHIFRLSDTAELEGIIKKLNMYDKLLDHRGNVAAAVIPKVLAVLDQALGKRATLLDYNRPPSRVWTPKDLPPSEVLCSPITFGLLLSPEHVGTALDKGPAANEPEAAEFRSFWGDKSELRRFQDGSILEAVLWPAQGMSELRLIPKQIVHFILERHFFVRNVDYIGGQLDKVLDVPGHVIGEGEIPYNCGEELHVDLIRSLDSLSNSLRQLKDLSLPVTSVQGSDAAFRFAEVFPPLPSDFPVDDKITHLDEKRYLKIKEDANVCPTYIHALQVVLHMEGSGKWPDSLEAVQRVKAALVIELAKALTNELHLRTLPFPSYLDVLKDGYVFRLWIACRKELVLLKQVTTSEGTVKIRETEQYKRLNLYTELMPRLTSILHGIQQQYPVFGVTCRLAKRWVASHLLLHLHVPEVCVELLVAYVFLHPVPYAPPNSPISGLSRFLSLLAHHDWKTTPLIINLNQNFTKDDLSEIHSHFSSHRPILPAMFLSTPLDKTGSLWTRKAPSGPILHRLIVLAKASLQLLLEIGQSEEHSKLKVMFCPSLDMYDVLIHLRPKQVPRRYQSLNSDGHGTPTFNYTRKHAKGIMPIVGFDPVQCYLKDLKDTFGEFALFFYDIYGGSFVGVVWKPQAFEAKPFKVSHINCRREGSILIDGSKSLVPNVEAILENFAILGSGLVQRIQTKTEKWSI